MISAAGVDVVVASARPADAVRPVLAALAVAAATAQVPKEQICVVNDNPGGDGVEQLVARHGFMWIRGEGRVGPGAARNVGAAAGIAPWLLFCDDDVVVDQLALYRACELAAQNGGEAIVGGLRPPRGVPRWVVWAYEDLSMFAASAFASEGPIPPTHLCSALLLVRRDAFEAAGGFPAILTWEDVVLGLRIADSDSGARIYRDRSLAGVHLNVPHDWAAWLHRQQTAGRRLAELGREIPPDEHRRVIEGLGLAGGWRRPVKHAAARLPTGVLRYPVGRYWHRLAASAAFTRGYREIIHAVKPLA